MIKINGKYIRNIPEQVGKNKRDIFQLDTDLTALEVKVNTALAGVFHYKGSVATYGDLPSSDNEVGDVYNVLDTGKNYAWDGSAWDDLGGLVDLSNYYTKAEADAEFVDLDSAQNITGEKTFKNTLTVDTSTGATYTFKITPYASGARIGTSVTDDILTIGGYNLFQIRGNTIPKVNDTYNLGDPSLAWKDLYLSGKANIPDIISSSHDFVIYREDRITPAFIAGNAGETASIRYTFIPMSDNSVNLGRSNSRWQDLYLSRNLTNGTDSVTVEDLAALITYAKAQGWIS